MELFVFFVLIRNPIWPPLQDKVYLLVLIYKCKEKVLFCFVFLQKTMYILYFDINWTPTEHELLLSHILLQYVHFCMSNNSQKSVLVIYPQGKIRGKYPSLPPNSTSGVCAVVSKYKERWCIKSYFNHINTVQNIGIKFK